jgi:hypothetical protein
MPDEIVLEDAVGGMPPAAAQTLPAPPQPAPAPDLTQPLTDPEAETPPPSEEPPPDEPELPEEEGEPSQGRRSVVGDLVRERERRHALEGNLQQSQELIRQVMSLPGGMELLQAATTGQPPPRRPGERSPEDMALLQEAGEVAQDLGLYDAEGKPDLRTAARIVLRDRKRTEQMLQKALGPLQQTTMGLAAQPVIQHVLTVADQFGIDRNLVAQGLQATPPEHLSNPEVQQAVLMMALGTQTMLGTTPGNGNGGARAPQQRGTPLGRALRPPIYTEPPGGRPRATPQLDDVFRERLRSTGLKDEQINASLERFTPGAPNRLE